ncbi:hypothetical protein BDN72DRAFT_340767 [Pluteus cervinus]|uniref:Uncharacterized protein n=1 Tax=Pluteus cervinus TaxID=181527 RepID=A0ACD3AAV7_9AGAR|nr:hypothetical protein BDN72DRAFT_340767 [Pluteus cervinus]
MAAQPPGFSRIPQRTSQSPRRVTFVAESDKPRQPQSSSSRYSWPTLSAVIFHHARSIPPSPAPVPPPPQPSSSPRHSSTRPRRRKSRRSSSNPKNWSMTTVYNQENVDGDIAAYLQAPPSKSTTPSKLTNKQHATHTEEDNRVESSRHRYFHAVILTLRRFGRNVRGGSPNSP